MSERVVLLDHQLKPCGAAEKASVHTAETPLHLAFSCFVFNASGGLILQQRAHEKKTWPGVWSNTVCGHPLPDEPMKTAVVRRLKYEMRLKCEVVEMLPNYRYKALKDGIMENELCPVWVGFSHENPEPNPAEVAAYRTEKWADLVENRLTGFDSLSPWCKEEMLLLHYSAAFRAWWAQSVMTPYPC